MTHSIHEIKDGSVTTPLGYKACGVSANIKESGALDLGVLLSQIRCPTAAVFTTNQLKGESLLITREHVSDGYAQAIVVNSGNANACTGDRGALDAREIARHLGRLLHLASQDVLPHSTGVIGVYLPLPSIREGLNLALSRLSEEGGIEMARAIMTTDTVPKYTARKVTVEGHQFSIGGIAKGAGMIMPNMATMLAFLTTDATVSPGNLQLFLKEAVDQSFNRLTIDGDTSCDDTVVLMANGMSDSTEISFQDGALSASFREALHDVCFDLTLQLARDGEGVEKVAFIRVKEARTQEEALCIARSIANSPLVKTAIHGNDPNWGRILTAAGYSGVEFDPKKVDLSLGNIQVMHHGEPANYDETDAFSVMKGTEYDITLHLNQGDAEDFYITTDFSKQYIDINADYRHRT